MVRPFCSADWQAVSRLKAEEVDSQIYRNLAHTKAEISHFIDQIYNKTRLHSALNYLSPEEFETMHIDKPTTSGTLNNHCNLSRI